MRLSTAATTASRYVTRAVASLASPSPSRMLRICLGTRNERMMESTATGSGGEMIAPSVIAAAQVNDG